MVFGAGWDIMEKVLKAGLQVPPLILHLIKKGKHKVLFFPFIPKKHLKVRTLSEKAKRANYKMFNYVNLKALKPFVLYEK